MKYKTFMFIIMGIALVFKMAFGEDVPIIFVHGISDKHDPLYCWPTWDHPSSAARRIINEQYGGYTEGLNTEGNWKCHENTTLQSTTDPRKVYNFSFYHPDKSRGVIGSNGKYLSVDYQSDYQASLDNGTEWAENLADFIDKVIQATGGKGIQKVDIVAHSMGGLVARAAIAYYGCASKVRKLLTIGTPNLHFDDNALVEALVAHVFPGYATWQKRGELLEMGVDAYLFLAGVQFEDTYGNRKTWCQWLYENDPRIPTATIAGDRETWWSEPFADNDGLAKVSRAHLDYASFKATIHASHARDWAGHDEVGLVTSTYVTEFIKNWIIDDDVSHKGATYDENCFLFPTHWYGYELRFWAPISDYSKALAMTAVLTTMVGQVYEETYKGYGIYKYSRNVPGTPVFATNPAQFSAGEYKLYYRVYDMNGLVVECPSKYKLVNSGENMPARVTIISPNGSENYGYEVCQIKWSCEFYHATTQKLYFSADNGAHWSLIGPVAGDANVFDWYIPAGINSNQCRIKVAAYLDAMTIISDISDSCFTIDSRVTPYDLQALFVSESEVWLSWDCDGIINFEVQRMLKGTNIWEVIAQGYWGLPAELHDTDVERNTTYYYRVRSYGVFQGETFYSDFCDPIEVTTPLLNRPYYQLYAYATSSDEITVSYVDRSSVEDGFEVWRKGAGHPWESHATLGPNPNNDRRYYIDTDNVLPCSTYWYKMMAFTNQPPAGSSAFTWTYGATAYPHLVSSRDSATAFQPKVLFNPNDGFYHMTYAAESLIFASRSDNGLDWEGINAICYRGQAGADDWECGFSQIDMNENNIPVVVFSMASVKFWPGGVPRWHNAISMGYFDADSNKWLDSINVYFDEVEQENQPPFHQFAFKVIEDTVHLVYFVDNILKYRWCNFATLETGNPIDIGTFTSNPDFTCYPMIDNDEEGSLYVAWLSGESINVNGWPYFIINYRERINGIWQTLDSVLVPNDNLSDEISVLSLRRIRGKTYIVSSLSFIYVPVPDRVDHSIAYSVKDGDNWQTEWVIADTTAGHGQLLTENLILYALEVNNDFDIYYQEKIGTGWSDPICIKNTVEKSKFPQGVFDGENIALIWTEGDAAPYIIDTAKVRVIPHVEIVFPTVENILGSRLRAGLPLEINWTSSDNVGVGLHRVYYSLDYGATYTQIGGDLSGTTYELSWTVPDTIVSGLMLKVEAYDGAGMLSAQEKGSFITTKEFVLNPNFEDVSEDKPYLWTSYGTGDVFEADWEYVQNGQFSAHIARGSADGYFGFYQKQIPVEPNTKYWLQGYIKTQSTAGTANLAFGVWHSDPDTNHHRDFGNIAGNTDWTYVCDSLTTRPYEDTFQVMAFGNPDFISDARFDNLTLLIDTVAPQIIVSYPNGGESLLVEEKIQIHWYATDNVKMGKIDSILYSIDAGQNWNVIAVDLPETINSYE